MFVITQGRYSDTRVIGVVKDKSEIPKGILEQEDIDVFEAPVLPYIGAGYKPYEVFINRGKVGRHDARAIRVDNFVSGKNWINGHTVYRLVLAKTPEDAVAQVVSDLQKDDSAPL